MWYMVFLYTTLFIIKNLREVSIMATLTYTSQAQHRTSVLAQFARTFVAFFEGIREGLQMADAYHAYSRMSDAELARHGLTRADISRAVALGHMRPGKR
jgi:hypothetical protein